jgi:hypothetical protein
MVKRLKLLLIDDCVYWSMPIAKSPRNSQAFIVCGFDWCKREESSTPVQHHSTHPSPALKPILGIFDFVKLSRQDSIVR